MKINRLHSTRFVTLLALMFVFLTSSIAANPKPVLSRAPLTTEQLEIYRAFLSAYTNGSGTSHLNLANRTDPLDLSEENSCFNGLNFDGTEDPELVFHEFDPSVKLSENVILVDPKKQNTVIRQNDPSHAIRKGTTVDDAVSNAFKSGLLTLSEIAFDKTHQYAVMNFSFVCGGLCGHGEAIIFQKVNGQWKRTDRQCRSWVS